jgi:hypothetical protein
MSSRKEPRFFSNDRNYARGLQWYAETYFGATRDRPARGEASPHYLYFSERVAPRIRQAHPDAEPRFVAIFREPVQRAYSQYWYDCRYKRDDWPFERAITHEEERVAELHAADPGDDKMTYAYFGAGLYARQLQPFLQQFSRDRFLFLLQDDLREDFGRSIRRLLEFLEIDPGVEIGPIASNPAKVSRSHWVTDWLDGGAEPGRAKELLKSVLPANLRRSLKRRALGVATTTRYPPMDPALRNRLAARYRDEVAALEQIIGRDLSAWCARER